MFSHSKTKKKSSETDKLLTRTSDSEINYDSFSNEDVHVQQQHILEAGQIDIATPLDSKASKSYLKLTKEFIQLSAPFAGMRMLDVGAEIVGSVLFLRLGRSYLAANGLIIPMQRFLTSTGTSLLFSMGTYYRENKNDPVAIGEITRKGALISLAISVPAMAIAGTNGYLLRALGLPNELTNIVENFYLAALPSIPFTLLQSVMQQFTLGGLEKPKISFAINLVNNIILIGTGIVLTEGLFGAPQLNETGYGAAYSVAYGVTTLGSGIFFSCHPLFQKYHFYNLESKIKHMTRDILKLGSPLGLQVASDYLLRYALAIMVGWRGDMELSSARSVEMIYIMMFTIILRAPQVTCNLTKDAYTDQNKQLIKRVTYVSTGTLMFLTAIWSSAALGAAKPLLGLFIDTNDENNQNAVKLANELLWIYPIGLATEVIRYTVAGSLRGLKDTKSSMWNSIGLLNFIGIPLLFMAYHYGANTAELYLVEDAILGAAAVSLGCQWASKVSHLFEPLSQTANFATRCYSSIYNKAKSFTPAFFCSQESTNTLQPSSKPSDAAIIPNLPERKRWF